MVPIKRF